MLATLYKKTQSLGRNKKGCRPLDFHPLFLPNCFISFLVTSSCLLSELISRFELSKSDWSLLERCKIISSFRCSPFLDRAKVGSTLRSPSKTFSFSCKTLHFYQDLPQARAAVYYTLHLRCRRKFDATKFGHYHQANTSWESHTMCVHRGSYASVN